jgi:hypothetical protein
LGAKHQTGLAFHIIDKMLRPFSSLSAISLLLFGALPGRVLADQVLTTSGFSTCLTSSNITVQKLDITYDNDAKNVTFDVAGTSTKSMNVTAILNVTAYGVQVYQNSFNPCDSATYVSQLCPGKFGVRLSSWRTYSHNSQHLLTEQNSTSRYLLRDRYTSYTCLLRISNSLDCILDSRYCSTSNVAAEVS